MKQKLLFIFALLCMVAQGAWSENVVNLMSRGVDYEAKDGDVLTGTQYRPYKITIAAGAHITLRNVTIWGSNDTKRVDHGAGDYDYVAIYKFAGITCEGDATITLEGNNIVRGYWQDFPAIQVGPTGKTLTIKGTGSLDARYHGDNMEYRDCSAIGGGKAVGSIGNIVIEGGNITAYGGNKGAAIGGYDDDSCGDITIKGGTITAVGGEDAPGIGGGGEHGTITISGGTITATGGSEAAGIGGAEDAPGGNIFIYGGDITATGGDYAAGIGGGDGDDGGNITITDGTIKAYGGKDGAGIGGGESGDSGSIVISGGNIYASGSGYGVGIGAGEDGDVDYIAINGGIVDAYGGFDIRRAIGGEDDEDYSHISIGDNMKVTDIYSGTNPLNYVFRNYNLDSFIRLKFEPCDHAGQTSQYVYVDQYKHKFACQWCGWHEENHTGDFECNKCVYEATPLHVHYYEMVYDEQSHQYKYQEVEAEAVHSYSTIVIHALSNTVPADQVFVGWVNAGGVPDANDNGLLKDDESLWSPGTAALIEGKDRHYKARYVNKTLDLATVTSDQTVYDGVVVTGTLDTDNYPVKITIANNATVTLSNANIIGVNEKKANGFGLYEWAGITCDGNATIILADRTTNTVKGFYEDYPGIFVPQNYTLTIKGTGSLDASSNGFGAGIGGGYASFVPHAGNINIQGGVITATCGQRYAAGIGSSHNNSCGDITISGGTIIATGGEYAAGIGSGWGGNNDGDLSSCGAISISSNVTCVTATKGSGAPNSIGAGYNATCGNVSIGGVAGAITRSPYSYLCLANAASNGSMISRISANSNNDCDVLLKDRTIYKDRKWNTLCLPFDVTLEGSPLAGAEARTLSSANLSDGTLTLNFSDPVTTLTAGTPYIIKWEDINEEELSLKNADFVIRTADDWNTFAQNVNNATADYYGKTVALAADITVSKMVGESEAKSFKGTFNGNGHTLTFTNEGSGEYNAPFRYIYGATISNLHTKGTINTSSKFSSGLVAYAESYNVINNCWSSVEINSTVNGDGTHGGLVAYTEEGRSNTTLNNCLFDGKIIGANTHSCGGLVGWNYDVATLNNCVCRPESITLASSNNATFSRGSNVSVYNCYYSENLPGASGQGTAIGTMSNENLVAALGDGWQIKDGKVVPGIMVFDFSHIENPTFTNVTISATTPTDITPTGDGSVSFKGTFDPVTIGEGGDDTKLYLGSGNKLYWPSGAMSINAFRAYFQLNNIQPNEARAFVLNFDGGEQTGITTTDYTNFTNSNDAWYDLSGRKLSGKPTKKGLYINNGRKVVIK